jgi:hypothetical protein
MKRFTDTELWDQEWFMELTPKQKCLVQYFWAKCDNAGVLKPNWKLISLQIGEDVSENDLSDIDKGRQFESINGKVWAVEFIKFQQNGKLSYRKPPHRQIIRLLTDHGLWQRFVELFPAMVKDVPEGLSEDDFETLPKVNDNLSNTFKTLSEKNETLSETSERLQVKVEVKDKVIEKGGSGGKEKSSATWQPRDDGGMPLGQMREVLSGDALRERVTLWIHNETAVFLDPDRYLDRVDSFLLLAEQDPEGYNLPNSRLLENRFRNWLKYNANPPKNRMPGAEKKPDFFAGCSPKQIEFLKSQGYDEFGRQSNPLKKVD